MGEARKKETMLSYSKVACILLLMSSCSMWPLDHEMRVPKKTEAVISRMNSRFAVLEYSVEGVTYTSEFSKSGKRIGELYYVVYDSIDPNVFRPLFYEKHHNPSEEVYKTYGIVKKINFVEMRLGYVLFYDCIIGDKSYKFTQMLAPDYKKVYPNIKKGDKFEVECLRSDPANAVIFLDRPVLD